MKAEAEALKQLLSVVSLLRLAVWECLPCAVACRCHRSCQVKSLHVATPDRAAMLSFAKQLSALKKSLSRYNAGVVMANALGRARAR